MSMRRLDWLDLWDTLRMKIQEGDRTNTSWGRNRLLDLMDKLEKEKIRELEREEREGERWDTVLDKRLDSADCTSLMLREYITRLIVNAVDPNKVSVDDGVDFLKWIQSTIDGYILQADSYREEMKEIVP